jgi:hypothetical protein
MKKSTCQWILSVFTLGLVCLGAATQSHAAKADFVGRWALTADNGAGWLKVQPQDGWYDGSLLWGGGSVIPLASVTVADDLLTVTRLRGVQRKNAAGVVVRTQQFTDVITAKVAGDTLTGEMMSPRADGTGVDRRPFTGKRIADLPSAPDLKKAKWGAPITLFNGRDLTGWRLIEPQLENGWKVESGALVNRPVQTPGQPEKRYGNLRTDREFEDFNLTLEVKVPPGNNSGIYLRGIYEVQVLDSHGKPVDSHHMGAIYSRITPKVAAEKPAGEWQSLDITLLDRHITVLLNGVTIIDNQPLEGVTGGALWSDEFRAGPLYLQGDHGAVDYRNLVLRPVLK